MNIRFTGEEDLPMIFKSRVNSVRIGLRELTLSSSFSGQDEKYKNYVQFRGDARRAIITSLTAHLDPLW